MKHGLFAELKRRHVYRVAIAYGVVGWVVIEVATQIFPAFHMPDWAPQLVIFLIVLGFPVTLVIAWAFEVTPEGVRRTKPAESLEARTLEQHRKVRQTLNTIIIGVLAVAVTLLAWRVWSPRKVSPGTVPVTAEALPRASPASSTMVEASSTIPTKSIAVLPFENLSSDKDNKYFADGMQDLILTKLASIGDLAVISRTSTMKYGSHPEDLTTVGKQLGVGTILEGSVQKVGDQVLVNVQLIDTRNDHHIWADSYTRTLKNVFSVEGEVAQKIADKLKAKLSPAETRRLATTLSDDPAANDLYLQGDYFTNRALVNFDTAAMKKAIAFYQQAIDKAPDFAQARARLSYTESMLAWFGGGGERTAPLYADALTQAEQALKLAPDLAEAHLALGYYEYWGKSDYTAALKAFATTIALRPNDTGAMAAKAFVLRRLGKFKEAIHVFQKALALDPRNSGLSFNMGVTFSGINLYAQAEQAYEHALALDPANATVRVSYAGVILFSSGNLSKTLSHMQGSSPITKLNRVQALTYARKYQEALTLLQSMPDSPDTFNTNNYGPKSLLLANLYRLRGDSAKARVYYAEALTQSRAEYAALAGSPIGNQALALINVANAELGLGRTKAGLADTAKALAFAGHSSDLWDRPSVMELCAQLYAQAGRADKAVNILSTALATPGIGVYYSPVMLWIDPVWDPIRKTPAFQELEKKYARYQPASLPSQAKG